MAAQCCVRGYLCAEAGAPLLRGRGCTRPGAMVRGHRLKLQDSDRNNLLDRPHVGGFVLVGGGAFFCVLPDCVVWLYRAELQVSYTKLPILKLHRVLFACLSAAAPVTNALS